MKYIEFLIINVLIKISQFNLNFFFIFNYFYFEWMIQYEESVILKLLKWKQNIDKFIGEVYIY